MKGRIRDMGRGFDGSLTVTLTLPPQYADEIHALMQDDISAEIKKWRDHRSKDANALMWAVCQEIGSALVPPVPKEDVYRKAIRDVGEYEPLPIKAGAVERFCSNWATKGIGWFADVQDDSKIPGYKLVFAYYGSSTYDTKQMSVLLDYLIDDAEQMGIVLKAGPELERLAKEYGK
jgi:hypothetical protein